ncbi:MAG: DinB family protein [Gemmatimonadales bacterium]
MKHLPTLVLALALAVGAARSASAQAAPPPAGQRGDMIAQFDDAATKLIQLAEVMPQDKFGWRPGTGVRSVSEVLMHVAGGNYFILTFAGVKAPAGATDAGEASVTDRAQVIARLKQSCDHFRAALRAASDADLDKPTTMFGRPTTTRNVYLTIVTHAHEHLGQMIAYARTNGVVPPWSMPATR